MVTFSIQAIDEHCQIVPVNGERDGQPIEVSGVDFTEACDRLAPALEEIVRRGEDCLDLTMTIDEEAS